jgi:hypothetical protein
MANAFSRDDLLGFLDHVAERGLMPAATAKALAVAVRNVLGVLSDTEQEDLSALDQTGVIKRFTIKRARDFNPSSLREYGRRFERAISLYETWREDPANFSVRTRDTSSPKNKVRPSGVNGLDATLGSSDQLSLAVTGGNSGAYTSSFPIRPDWVVTVANVPTNLSTTEAERLATFIRMLAVTPAQ